MIDALLLIGALGCCVLIVVGAGDAESLALLAGTLVFARLLPEVLR